MRFPHLVVVVASCLLLPGSATLDAQAPSVTRRDLADAYLQVDRAAMSFGLPEDRRADWNRRFDRTTLAFFGGDFPRVIRGMHDLLVRIAGDSAVASPTRRLLALRIEPTQRVLVRGTDRTLEVMALVMYTDSTLNAPRTLAVRVLGASGAVVASGTITIPADAPAGSTASVRLDAASLVAAGGRFHIEATLPGAKLPLGAQVFAMPESGDAARERLGRGIAALPASADAQSLASVRARAALIADRPDPANSAQFLADPAALGIEVESESRTLAAGGRPYARAVGDLWRVVVGPAGPIPVRIYAPRAAAGNAPMPVVIALHGAGGDENMFMDGYGAGRIKALADSMRFIVVSPATTAFSRDLGGFDSTLAVLERDYAIDRSRVYVVGHSMGAAAAMRIGAERRDAVRAVALLAGAGVAPAGGRMAPTLFIAAETDLIIPAARVRAGYEQALASGAPVEFMQAEGWGHTLVVGARIDDAVRWLFAR